MNKQVKVKLKPSGSLYPILISDSTLEALKWLAMLSMTVDHANRFFWHTSSYAAYCFGRLAMPLFAFIFAYNLARPGVFERGFYFKTFRRLTFFGILATPAYMAMKGLHHLWPLNIMFMLLIAAFLFFLYEKKGIVNILIALFLFLLGSAFVEYSWPGVLFCISCWFYCRNPSIFALIATFYSYYLIGHLNENNWALVTLPLIIFAAKIELRLPRIPYFFYIYYPGHLTLFWLLSRIIYALPE
ncbi:MULTISPECIES: TraX family protein [unclassified Legionella]|uniref:TraX family protein n=1 Tax=unclassified Legionella TaxID=2622702 RepID=UPI00105575B8|nr:MULTISPECIES: TraX family protein [unclassified Legionella]MDI9818523.1 TraX family protein [Legionella sp. PL877]